MMWPAMFYLCLLFTSTVCYSCEKQLQCGGGSLDLPFIALRMSQCQSVIQWWWRWQEKQNADSICSAICACVSVCEMKSSPKTRHRATTTRNSRWKKRARVCMYIYTTSQQQPEKIREIFAFHFHSDLWSSGGDGIHSYTRHFRKTFLSFYYCNTHTDGGGGGVVWFRFLLFKVTTKERKERKKGEKTNDDSTSSHSPDRVERSLTGFLCSDWEWERKRGNG